MSDRWFCKNEDGTYTVGEGDEEIATCKYREDALILRGGFMLDEDDKATYYRLYEQACIELQNIKKHERRRQRISTTPV